MQTPVSLIPDIQVLAYFSVFYCFGWLLYKSKNLFESMTDYAWLFMVSAVILALIKAAMLQYLSPDLVKNICSKKVIAVSAVALWLFTFGITGLFIKYTNKPSAIMRYVSDASYWIYLVHLPLTVVIPAFIYNWPVPAMVKFLTVLAITTFLSFLSYHLFVRSTFIGKFLNGRRYPKRLT